MNKFLSIIGAGLLILSAASCREESDPLMAYDQNEVLVFAAADTSFAAKFKVMWNGMNQYYALWDYEAEQGIDWDAVYDEYYPQFAALDQRATVSDDELQALLDNVFGPLHDGHFYMSVINHKTGSIVEYQPSVARLKARVDFPQSMNFNPSLNYYTDPAHGEVETDANGDPIAMEASTMMNEMFRLFTNTPGKGLTWIKAKIQELEALASPTEMQAFQLQNLKDLNAAFTTLNGLPFSQAINIWNGLQVKYSFLNVPGFDYFDPGFADGLDLKFALLKGNIAYFYLNSFALTSYMSDSKSQSDFNMNEPTTQQYVNNMRKVWQTWFNAVQTLHKNGTLGGVIIDVRNNGGGLMSDSEYVVGSLVPAGGIHFGYQRFKRGSGRYEYSPMMNAIVKSMSTPHETITEPVVILVNCQSVSMSETSALCVKTMPNGTVIGKRSFGAICALTGNEDNSYNYAGYIGVKGVTSVFGNVPSMASYTLDRQLIEAQGITPDIEVDLDVTQFLSTGKDTQLDRALLFLRTGQ